MTTFLKRQSLAIVSALVMGFFVTGCSQNTKEKFTPSLSDSEGALQDAMNAWKAGVPAGEIPDTKPLVHISDQDRKPGQKLSSFEIMGEVPGSAGRTFVVNLQLTDPSETVKARYLVVGIDPVWVFRQEDYELLMHWDHHMPSDKSEPTFESKKN